MILYDKSLRLPNQTVANCSMLDVGMEVYLSIECVYWIN